jgi:hypothetical protein
VERGHGRPRCAQKFSVGFFDPAGIIKEMHLQADRELLQAYATRGFRGGICATRRAPPALRPGKRSKRCSIRISTANGRQAQIKASNNRTIGGVTFEIGPSVDVVPTVAADGSSLDMTVIAQIRHPRKTATGSQP